MSELLCPICGKNVQSVNVTPDCQHTSREIFEYIYSIKAELDEMTADSKQVSDYADEAIEDASKFLNERNALQVKLDIVVEALKKYSDDKNWNRYTYYDGEYVGGQLAQEALKKLEDM